MFIVSEYKVGTKDQKAHPVSLPVKKLEKKNPVLSLSICMFEIPGYIAFEARSR